MATLSFGADMVSMWRLGECFVDCDICCFFGVSGFYAKNQKLQPGYRFEFHRLFN